MSAELTKYKGVWVFIEQMEGKGAPVSWELLGEGRKLADKLDTYLAGILLGDNVDNLAQEAFAYGADKVFLVASPVLKHYRTQPYAEAIVNLSKKHMPEVILMGATTMGRDLSGTVATKLGTGLTADCTQLDVEEESRYLLQSRPAFGGNIMATIICRHRRPQMATVRPRIMDMPQYEEGRQGELIREDLSLAEEDVAVKVVDYIKEKGKAVYLDKAEIIVAGGRGLGSKENFRLIEQLAEVLGGTVGASRAAVEAGWISADYQVGQTGTTVRPKVYFAIGISGAIQHLVGMQTSDVIVAVNKDPDASIFKVATFGIQGDMFQVLPAMIEQFKKQLVQ
ncbi:electron transfer flavoprotein subunit alpha/FixB family protein [Metallumcola ferriviriculae]|uniref:Electron transfer flavoprotein subunit alpha/FixB family protein n=2 Tax=Metallumcola ferriviriculae TaxID=3039180 RepID=A0AAU0UK16_9FIRM|nr:electron transfer flavoprotein subunit alpha/FixB family protein [Desulfitibacteraceae bacterium MK1]